MNEDSHIRNLIFCITSLFILIGGCHQSPWYQAVEPLNYASDNPIESSPIFEVAEMNKILVGFIETSPQSKSVALLVQLPKTETNLESTPSINFNVATTLDTVITSNLNSVRVVGFVPHTNSSDWWCDAKLLLVSFNEEEEAWDWLRNRFTTYSQKQMQKILFDPIILSHVSFARYQWDGTSWKWLIENE